MIGARLLRIAAQEGAYVQSYTLLSNFLIGIKDSTLETKYIINEDDRKAADKAYDDARRIVLRFASTLLMELEGFPTLMSKELKPLCENLTRAKDAADRLFNDQSDDTTADNKTIVSAITGAGIFVSLSLDRIDTVIENLNNFYNQDSQDGGTSDLLCLKDDLDVIVSNLQKSIEYDNSKVKTLNDEINDLRNQIDKYQSGVLISGVTSGVSLFLAAGCVGLGLATANPLFAVGLGVFGFVSAASAVGAIGFSMRINQLEMSINLKTQALSGYEYAIVQMQCFKDTYDGFVSQIGAIKDAVKTIRDEWSDLGGILSEMGEKVKMAGTDYQKEVWGSVSTDLASILEIAGKVQTQLDNLNVKDLKVSDGDYYFDMTQSEMQSAYDKSQSYSLSQYLMLA